MAAMPAVAFAGTSGPSPIPNPPNFQVSTNALLLCKGVINYVPLRVANLGQQNGSITMESLQLGLTSSKYLVTVENGTTNTITLPPNTVATTTLPIFVSLNSSTLISAGISVNYDYLSYYSDSEVRNVSFGSESCPSQLSATISPSVLTSGKIENVSFKLSNSGRTPLNNVSVKASLSPQQGEVLSSQPVLVGLIPALGNTTIKESLFINSTSQTFPINLSISFYNGTRLEQLSDSIAVLSSGIVDLVPSSITVSPAAPTAGSVFSISFVLTNLGTTQAAAVTATVLPPSGVTAFGSNSVFVGSIAVDSQTPVTLSLSSSSRGGSYTVPIEITYLNNLRQQINSTMDVPITVYASNFISSGTKGVVVTTGANGTTVYRRSSGSGVIIIIILAIAVVVLLALLYRERRRHRKTPNK
jgi:hypothetical protein